MPRTSSAKKALRASHAKRAQNLVQGAQLDRLMRTFVRTADHAAEEVQSLQKAIDKAAKNGLIHARKAGRLKSKFLKKSASAAAHQTKKASSKKKAATKRKKTSK